MSCARCGCGIYKTEEFISLNKIWHKYCFTCYQCRKRLDKDSAKIFQGELFCENCYTNVIEKLFEVISTPSVNKPGKVASTPSCAVTNNNSFEQRLKNCENLLKNLNSSQNNEYGPENQQNKCIQRSAQSCSCIPNRNESKDEYCFIFPIPREVANYYNRIHMKNNKAYKEPINCSQCCCKKANGSPQNKCPIQVRTLKEQCCCNSSSPPRCRNSSPQGCCCSSSAKSQTNPVAFKKVCGCCVSQKNPCCEPCPPPPKIYSSSDRSPCQQCSCCSKQQAQSYTPKCPQQCCSRQKSPSPQSCPPPRRCPLSQCCPPPPSYALPPRCPAAQRSDPPQLCPQKMEGCSCTKSEQTSENNSNNCKKPQRCCCQTGPKYCVCGNLSPCNCKISQIRAQCTVCCIRCGQKVYAAEKILVSSGSYHTSCFTCFCCNKCLDVKNVYEGCGEIYCKQCYNHFFGVDYYGFGGGNC